MLKVSDVLQHPLFNGAKVVGGHSGLDHVITWVHNAAVPNAAYWLDGGELALTTLFNMPKSQSEQVQYVRDMASKHVAALVITVGEQIEAIPDYLCQVADACGLPLIELSYQVRFVEIAKALNQHIIQENMALVQRALEINKRLTQIVLDGGSMGVLAEQLTDLVGHSISIETERFEAIATKNIADVDEARRYTQKHGQTDPRLVEALEQRGILPKIRQTLRPVHIPPMPDVGLEMERILAPVVVHGEVYGYLWIIADVRSTSEIDMMAIEIGATIAALMLLYQESVQSAEASLKGSLLSQLIQGDSHRQTILTDQSMRYGVDLRLPFVVLLVDSDAASTQSMYRRLNQMITSFHIRRVVVGQFAGQVMLLAQADEHYHDLAKSVQERLVDNQKRRVRVGVSGVHQGAECVKIAYKECEDVLAIMARLEPAAKIVHFPQLGYLHTLYHAGPASLVGNLYAKLLDQLLDEKQADLFQTLEAYLDSGGNGVSTAESLHIHRSTLNYRLGRITALCGVDLQDAQTRINLHIALKLRRLFPTE